MLGIRTLILWRQNMVTQFILTRPILDLCKTSTRRPGARVSRQWWEQTGIDLKGAQEKAAEAAEETEMDADSESEDEPEGAAGGSGEEEESQGASGSSGAEWSVAKDD